MDKFRYLIDLFECIDITEKGIEKVYNYLLLNKTIEDPKVLQKDLDINSFQRVYKIIKVLKDLDLVQTYGRPMKAILNSPVETWQKIISKKIEEIQHEASERIHHCENAFELMLNNYSLSQDQPDLPPVEFLNVSQEDEHLGQFMRDIFSNSREICFAKDLHFDLPFKETSFSDFGKLDKIGTPKDYEKAIVSILREIENKKIKILFSEEYIKDVIPILADLSNNYDQKAIIEIEKKYQDKISAQIRVHPSAVGNFIVKDQKELLQYSIHPSNYLIGLFISRQEEIISIFKNKFEEKFKEANPLFKYLKENGVSGGPYFNTFLLFLI